MKKVIQINHDGALSLDGQPLDDRDFGKAFLASLYKKDHVCRGMVKGEMVFVEATKAPLVVQDVEEVSKGTFSFEFPYGHKETFELSKGLQLDDWSRLCGENEKGVPFVFSISAQVKFLDKLVEPLDYDSFRYQGEEHEFTDWYVENPDTAVPKFWSERYDSEVTPWDLQKYHPFIDLSLPQLKLSKSKILVPGCGRGHDPAKLASLGHNVTALDFSSSAIKKAKELYGSKVNFMEADFFEFANDHVEEFDIVFEHTLFCALSPAIREKIIKSWKKVLRPGGYLMGSFLVASKRMGPPFGITEWELEQLLGKHFKIDYWGRLRGEATAREGKELFVYAQKRS